MKFCPYCGAELMNSEVSFCVECGKKITPEVSASGANPGGKGSAVPKKEKKKSKKDKPRAKRAAPIPEIVGEPVDDYDGYYNDVLPPDLDRVKEGMDKELIKKIVALAAVVLVIIGLCVLMMYML